MEEKGLDLREISEAKSIEFEWGLIKGMGFGDEQGEDPRISSLGSWLDSDGHHSPTSGRQSRAGQEV